VTANGGDRAGAVAWKLQQGAEALSAQKAAAIVASTAAIAGGAAVHDQSAHHVAHHSSRHEARASSEVAPVSEEARPAPLPIVDNAPDAAPAEPPSGSDRSEPVEASQAAPAGEFVPEATAPRGADADAVQPALQSRARGRVAARPAAGGGEFGP
jgi:hypothetical protein